MKYEEIISSRHDKVIYRDGNMKIKLFGDSHSKTDIINEALNQSKAEDTGLYVPKVLSVENIDGKWAIISEYIPGKTIEQLIAENPEKTHEYIEMMVKLHIDVLSKPCKVLNRLNDNLTENIMSTDLDAITKFDLYRRITQMPQHAKLCHGDFTTANVCMSDDGKLYILDWSWAAQGNASTDVAKTCLRLRVAGKEEEAREYLDIYVKETGKDKAHILKWFPIVAVALSANIRKEHSEKLLAWFKNKDFE